MKNHQPRCKSSTSHGLSKALQYMFIVALAWTASGDGKAAASSRSLQEGWQVRIQPGTAAAKTHAAAATWLPAHVPGSVQTDLLAAKLIPDPYYRDNESKLQWIGLADWQYRLDLHVDASTLQERHVELVFDGLDTFADVTLNGKPLLTADNMFRSWRVPAKLLLHAGDNELQVTLHSPVTRIQSWLAKQAHALPGEFESPFGDEAPGKQSVAYVRKANYHFGWDWGPRYITLGIWQPVRLESWSGVRLADFHVAQPHVDADVAQLQATYAIQADHAGKATLRVEWTAPDGTSQSATQDVTLHAGDNALAIPLRIEHPQRWWPVGYGEPNLYRFRASVSMGGQLLASAERDTGLRSVELRRDRDRWGRGFAFVVNGVPIFAKGANFVPMDEFPERVTPARIEQLLRSARDANMNMLRVWGGGYYQDDAFYASADRLGLMIWQEFMFGGPVPPHDRAFQENVRIEAEQQVRRLRDHPSIVFWSGNNEVQTGWESWPDRKEFAKAIGPAERTKVEQGMRTLFGGILRQAVQDNMPEVPYWASSPSTDFEGPANQLTDGDYHSWNVWSGSKPIEQYLDETPRFQSEYGLQSFPVLATIDAFTEPGDRSPESPVMRAHQKFDKGNGNQRLLLYIRKYYGEPKDFPSFVYLSQLMQAEGIELAAEHLRSARPQSMGSLYWQLNDVWPGASWSSVDYFGRWKALQFHAARFYAPVRVAPIRQQGRTAVYAISDRTAQFDAQLRTRVIDMDGRVLSEHTQAVHVAALASTTVDQADDATLLHGADPKHTLVSYELIEGNQTLSRHLLYFAPAKELKLPAPGLHATVSERDGQRVVEVSADKLARGVWLDFGALDARPSDNAFDLLPGEHVVLPIQGAATLDELRKVLTVRSLADAVTGSAP